jgi:hypothetical protein
VRWIWSCECRVGDLKGTAALVTAVAPAPVMWLPRCHGQAFPNSVNEAQFQNVILRPGETYHHEVAYTFKASK